MKWNVKRILAYSVLLFGLLAAAAPLIADFWRVTTWQAWDPTRHRGEAVRSLKTRGLSPELGELLAKGPKPEGWLATYVVEVPKDFMLPDPENPTILVADPPDLAGQTVQDLLDRLTTEQKDWRFGSGARVDGPDGKAYTIYMYGWDASRPPSPKEAAFAAFIAGLLAWLALAAWVWLDARHRGSAAAPGWLLLALLTGPVALAVWFISRYTQEGFAPLKRTCPGCGGETPRNSAFCVRCGHPLRPACPDCRRPVELDWAHCGACGSELK